MSFWREIIILTVVAVIASAIFGNLLEIAVLQIYPNIDPGELHIRVALVLICLTVLGTVWWFRR
jgi:hypothetical protein